MNKSTLIVLVLTFVGLSCTDSGTVPENPDEVLAGRIIGTWSSANNSFRWIEYKPNYLFADTISGVIARQGRYQITNGIIEYVDVYYSYLTPSGNPPLMNWPSIPERVRLQGDSLVVVSLNVLNPIQTSPNSLAGSWQSTYFQYFSPGDTTSLPYSGRVRVTYTFYLDTLRYKSKIQFLDGGGFWTDSTYGTYTYNPPVLLMNPPTVWPINVEFHGEKMYWRYDWTESHLGRIR
jgi:hypothetical protein